MSEKVVLHIGSDKTGSSAIQHYLHENGKSLRDAGCTYPNVGLQGSHHYGVAISHGFSTAQFDARLNTLLRSKIMNFSGKSILSSEHFWYAVNAEPMGNLSATLKDLPVQIVAYLRNHADYHISSAKEHIKWGGMFGPVFHQHLWKRADYEGILNRWQRAFPKSEFSVLSYDRECDDVVSSFLRMVGVSARARKSVRINPTPSDQLLAHQLWFNETYSRKLAASERRRHYVFLLRRIEKQQIELDVTKSGYVVPNRDLVAEWIRQSRQIDRRWGLTLESDLLNGTLRILEKGGGPIRAVQDKWLTPITEQFLRSLRIDGV